MGAVSGLSPEIAWASIASRASFCGSGAPALALIPPGDGGAAPAPDGGAPPGEPPNNGLGEVAIAGQLLLVAAFLVMGLAQLVGGNYLGVALVALPDFVALVLTTCHELRLLFGFGSPRGICFRNLAGMIRRI